MYQRQNPDNKTAQNQNNQPIDINTRQEIEAENQAENGVSGSNIINNIINTGNANAGKLLLGARNANDEEDDDLFGFFSDDNKKVKDVSPQKKEVEKEVVDLFGGFGEEVAQENRPVPQKKNDAAGKNKGAGSSAGKKENVINDLPQKEYGKKDPEKNIYPGERPDKPLFYEDPEEEIEENKEITDLDELNKAVTYKRPKKDLAVHVSRKNKNGGWRLEKAKKRKKKEKEILEADQKKVAGLNFSLHKLPERNKAGGFRKFLSNLAIAAGSTIGKGFHWIGAALARLFNPSYRKKYRQGQSPDTENLAITQESRVRDFIPGWNGEKFQKGPNGEDNILADFRRIPTVWSRITAAQAENAEGKPLAPKISVYVRQGSEEDTTLAGMDPGHTGLGIEYSRYSQRTRRYERYNLRYGFYPGGQSIKAGSLTTTGNAVIPGQLQNEAYTDYTVRRTFPATAQQVNQILKASETFADKGYNIFKRNCTTFVKEMVRDVARIPAGKEIFEQEAPNLSSFANFGLFAIKSSEATARASMEARMKRLGSEKDLNYGGEHNMRVTKQEYRQYKESLANSSGGYIGNSDLPNAAGENMRRLEGENAGIIGSKQYFGTAQIDPDNPGPSSSGSGSDDNLKGPLLQSANIKGAMENEADSLVRAILKVAGKRSDRELLSTPDLDPDLKRIFPLIKGYSSLMDKVADKNNDPKDLREARLGFDNGVNDLNTLLNVFHNDERIHMPVMHMISLLEWGIELADRRYNKTDLGDMIGNDVDFLRNRIDKPFPIKYKVANPNPDARSKFIYKEAIMSPSRYEAYLQIYKSPEKAIVNYSRLQELRDKKDTTKDEKKELQRLVRIDKLASQFDYAHNYMLEKDSYSQQDVDYAFSLGKMEKDKNVGGLMSGYYSSVIYKGLIFDKIFGNFTQRFENNFNVEDAENQEKLKDWLDGDMCECARRRQNEMETVIKALIKTMPGSTPDQILEQLMTEIRSSWIFKVFDNAKLQLFGKRVADRQKFPIYKANSILPRVYRKMIAGSKLKTELEKSVRKVFNAAPKADNKAAAG